MPEDLRVKEELLPGWTLHELMQGLRATLVWGVAVVVGFGLMYIAYAEISAAYGRNVL